MRGYDKLYAEMGASELIKERERLFESWRNADGVAGRRIRDKIEKVEKALRVKGVPEEDWAEEEADIG